MVIRITYSESWQEPSKAAEDESLNKADDVEQLPSLHVDAVDGKEDGDRAVDGNGESEHKEPPAIPKMITVNNFITITYWLGTLGQRNCRCRGSGGQIERHICHRCGSASLEVAWKCCCHSCFTGNVCWLLSTLVLSSRTSCWCVAPDRTASVTKTENVWTSVVRGICCKKRRSSHRI